MRVYTTGPQTLREIALLASQLAELGHLPLIEVRGTGRPAPGVRRWDDVLASLDPSATAPDVEVDPGDDATILYTWGTTGQPKGAIGLIRSEHRPRILEQPRGDRVAFTDGWFRTGDLGRVTDGWVYVVDRMKDVVIRGGENIYCAEVEAALFEHPAICKAIADRATCRVRDLAVVTPIHLISESGSTSSHERGSERRRRPW
jgi:acyl-CoA synthetase (AMP-forming)/AMP-acid ligase II